jgi:hypothetical protein
MGDETGGGMRSGECGGWVSGGIWIWGGAGARFGGRRRAMLAGMEWFSRALEFGVWTGPRVGPSG